MYDDKIKYGTLELYMDTSHRPEHHVTQSGIAHDDFKSLGIYKGNTLWFHYLSLKEENKIGKDGDFDVYAIEPEMLYAKGVGKTIETLNDHVLVDRIKQEQESDIIITTANEFSETSGIVIKGGGLDGE